MRVPKDDEEQILIIFIVVKIIMPALNKWLLIQS
jgi:hypothetical protein